MDRREKWDYIKTNMPELAEIIIEMKKIGLNPQEPMIELRDRNLDQFTDNNINSKGG